MHQKRLLSILSVSLLTLAGCPDDKGDGTENGEPSLDVSGVADVGGISGTKDAKSTPPDSNDVKADAHDFVKQEGFGEPCTENSDCPTGWCIETDAGDVCTQPCIESCPDGWLCKGITNTGGDVTFLCVPEQDPLCTPCDANSDCGGLGDQCLVIAEEGAFCSRECNVLNPCPDGYLCQEQDSGTPQCVPETGSCVCSHDILGQKQPCNLTNEAGTCWGFQVCIGIGGWGPCDAEQPGYEACNGVDDDCDGLTDEVLGGGACEAVSEFGTCKGTLKCEGEQGLVCTALPPTEEVCDGIDNDCDGEVDENEGDLDGDGIADCSDDDIDGDGDPNLSDCQPWDNTKYTGAPELCNGLDDDCDSALPLDETDTDEDGMWGCQGDCDDTNPLTFLGADEVCDGEDNSCDQQLPANEADEDGDLMMACAGDCNDDDPAVFAGQLEVCNDIDDDCDLEVDEPGADGCVSFYADMDMDGAGAGAPMCLCQGNAAYPTFVFGDCDDTLSNVSPLAEEVCDDIDNDCDTVIDEPGAEGCDIYLVDKDGDKWGATGDAACLCEAPPGAAADVQPGDCNDLDPNVHPGQSEVCDGEDTNCDGVVPEVENDLDEDGFRGCDGDCNDDVATIFPGAEEVCDGMDSNCDFVVPADEKDADKDGWPICLGDCNDLIDTAFPGAVEACNGIDDNCNGDVDEPGATGCTNWYPDADGDGFGPSELGQCLCTKSPDLVTPYGSDCNDEDPLEKPWGNAPCEGDGDCCQAIQSCQFGVCVNGPDACGDDDDCWGDTYCIEKKCIPFGIGPGELSKPSCDKLNLAGLFLPTLQCEWTGPPEGDPFPNHKNVLGTPMVADFNLDNDPIKARPSIVFVSYDGFDGGLPAASSKGVIRVLDGDDCTQLYNLSDHKVVGSSPLAIADMDLANDGRPEIVAHREGGGLVAFKYDPVLDAFKQLWVATEGGQTSTIAHNIGRWNGPSIVELDGDAFPEVMSGSLVFDHNGVLIASNLGYQQYASGLFDVVADVDLDGKAEYVDGAAVYEWTGSSWKKEAYSTVNNGLGHVAIADFGDFPVAGLPAGIPEIAVIRTGKASIQDLSGKVVFGPIQLPSWPPGTAVGTGGPPTVGDFDGDGVPELAAAGRGAYTIFDIGCTAQPLPLGCHDHGVLWFQWSQDYSSSVTGSSIYDFEADGLAEAVYSDECFTRIYEGLTGDVVFSQWRSSCTWYENPVVADTDGDFKAELVVGSNTNCNVQCPALDPIFRGLTCQEDTDCPSANGWCDVGRCRCITNDECGPDSSSYVCADALPNTPGSGKVCRAAHGGAIPGVRVYRDVADNWVVARPIWSQHAYVPSRISDMGQVHPLGSIPQHWEMEGHNNYRQNAQGAFDPELAPDMTADPGIILNCDADGVLTIPLQICNRGALPVAGGVTVGVFDGNPLTIGEVICLTATSDTLFPEDCETVSCEWAVPDDEPHDVYGFVDFGGPKGDNKECLEGNNQALWPGVTCTNW